ncbi:MAG: hypothetical protein DHS20C15_29490 [Planctomycetota bacterium]|nr:MAG: hypothetical protein DHS20C15_29490 [Planctomycetota bacterium]
MDLDALMHRFRGPLVGLIASWGNGPRDAIELAQDTFAEAYLSRERFRGNWERDGDVGPWLVGIASNLNHAQRRRRQGPAKLTRLESLDALPPESLSVTSLGERDDLHALRDAMASLRGPWHAVLTMRYVDGASLADIGALLGLGTRAVEGRLRRARQELQRLLEQRGVGPRLPAKEPRS